MGRSWRNARRARWRRDARATLAGLLAVQTLGLLACADPGRNDGVGESATSETTSASESTDGTGTGDLTSESTTGDGDTGGPGPGTLATADPTGDGGTSAAATSTTTGTPGSTGGTGADADPNELAWYLDGVEVARADGAEGDPTYLFLPHYGRNVQAYWPAARPGTYGCDEIIADPNLDLSLITSDNGWSNLENLPARWKTLVIADCNVSGTYPDTVDMALTLTRTQGRYTGTYWAQIIGAGERAGEVLDIEGTFDIAY